MLREILVTIFGLVVAANSYVLRSSNYKVCKTKECKTMASVIIKGMNKTVDPCEDFYSYACGSWSKNYPVPEGKIRWDLGATVQKKIEAFLKKTLQEEPSFVDSVPLSVEKKWIKACMDEDRIEQKGLWPLVKIIEKIGGWPIVMKSNSFNEKKFPWQNVAKYYANLIGGFGLFSVGIMPDSENSSTQVLTLGYPTASFLKNRLYIAEEEEEEIDLQSVGLFFQIPSLYAQYTGNDIDVKLLLPNVMRYFKFAIALQKIKTLEGDKKEITLNKMSINTFQLYYNRGIGSDTTKINWLEMFRALMKNTGIEIDGSEKIAVDDLSYFSKLITLLETTSHETIVNYMHWKFVISTLNYLNKEMRGFVTKANTSKTGINLSKRERLDECIANLPLNDGVTQEYLKQYFPENIKETATEMAAEIRKEIASDILHTSWMDRKTKLLAKEKLKAMKVSIGYPEYYKDDEKFDSIYDGIKVGPNYFDNVMKFVKYKIQKTLKNLRKPFDKDRWLMTPLTMNAYYFPPANSLTIPAAQILIPLFSSKGPFASNYGSVSFIIGHEMSHGFDVDGRKYDKNGNALPWWSNQVVANYEKRADCFIKQYDSYKVNGKLTQGENIADSSGLNSAFGAYNKKMKKVSREMRLPGLETVNGNQLFFIAFANTFCESATPFYESLTKKDVHTKASLRINGAVANVAGFADAFQCSTNSPLNLQKKCVLWD